MATAETRRPKEGQPEWFGIRPSAFDYTVPMRVGQSENLRQALFQDSELASEALFSGQLPQPAWWLIHIFER